ncbi:MAG TPA: hypothetical protein VM096_07110 [Vicinamibacterales bacterium]|nr:hypothetical protein [Vicinamibacterales bacterium]
MKNITFAFTLIVIASSAVAQPAPAAQVDNRLAGWIGCWRLDDDLAGTGARMCITPEKSGVRLQTVVGSNKGIDELVIPDGVSRPIADAECKGTEQAEWSSDGARIFRTTNVTCGKEAPRTIRTVAFMAPGPSWVLVQHLNGEGAVASVRVQRYRRAANQKLADGSTAPQPDANAALRATQDQARWSIEDVIEASAKLPAEVLQAALSEVHQGFDLNKKTLVLLNEGGVHESVIDLMVALTYPNRFVVERRGGTSAPSGLTTGSGWFDPFMAGGIGQSSLDCFSPYGYGYRSYYSMCGAGMYSQYGYNYYGYNGYNGYGGYYPAGGWVGIGAVPPVIGGGLPGEPQLEGRVVNGRGYTQIRNRESEPAPRVSSGGGNGSGWNGSGGGGGVSSGGYSSGSSSSGSSGGGAASSGDSGARVAVPKGGGQ